MKFVKTLVVAALAILAVFFAFKLVLVTLGLIFKILVPLAIVAGAVYVIYKITSKDKSLPGHRRHPLP